MEVMPSSDPSVLVASFNSEEQDLLLTLLDDAEKSMEEDNYSAVEYESWKNLRTGFREAKGNRNLIEQMEQAKRAYEEAKQKLIDAGILTSIEEFPPLTVPDYNSSASSSSLEDPDLDEKTKHEIEMLAYRGSHLAPGSNSKTSSNLPGIIPPRRPPTPPPGYKSIRDNS